MIVSLWWRVWSDFAQSRVALAGLVVLALVALAALCAPWITPQNPYDLMQLDVLDARLRPGSRSGEAGYLYLLGTDGQGRDLYSAIIYGLRISLLVGVGSAVNRLNDELAMVAVVRGLREAIDQRAVVRV